MIQVKQPLHQKDPILTQRPTLPQFKEFHCKTHIAWVTLWIVVSHDELKISIVL